MSSKHWKGPVIPEVGDDLLDAWPAMLDTAGILTTVASVAAARVALTAAETAGATITPATPAYFDINGIVYWADGTKNDTVWVLKPINEVEAYENSYSAGEKFTRGANQQNLLVDSSLPVAPYDRLITAWGMAAGDCTAGSYNLVILINNTDGQLSRWDSGSGLQSQAVINMGIVRAGVDPQVKLAVRSGSATTNTIQMNNNPTANKIIVRADPITMA